MDRTLLSRTAAFVVVALLSVTTLSCSDSSPPVSPELNLPGPARQIVDAAHSGGNAHFFWLPPMVAQPSGFNGAFDPSLSPVVRVCDLSDCDSQVVAEFTTASGTGSEAVQLESDHYVVDWHVDDSGVVPGPTYRIRVLAGGTQLGLADVQFGENGKEARNLTTNEVIGLNEGRTLPIKFRIEEGAVFVVSPADGGTVEALEGTVNLAIPPGALTEETGVTVESAEPTGEALVAVDFGPDGLTFEEPVPVTIGYDPLMLPPGLAESDLALNLLDGLGRWIVLPGSVVDPATHTVTAPFYHFSTGGVGAASLAVFCPDDGDPATFDDLTAAVDAVRRGGTVEVCEGTHLVQGVLVDRPITIQGAAGSRPTFTSAGVQVGLAAAPPSGTLTLRNLRFETAWNFGSDNPHGSALVVGFVDGTRMSYDQVVIEDVDLDVPDGPSGGHPGSGAWIFPSPTNGAHVTLRNVTESGGTYALYVFAPGPATRGASVRVESSSFWNPERPGIVVLDASEASAQGAINDVDIDNVTVTADLGVFATRNSSGVGGRVDVTNSTFSGGALWYQSGATGLIQGNTIDCGHGAACIRVRSGANTSAPEPLRVIGNHLVGATRDALWLTELDAGPFEIRDNQLDGTWAGGDRTDPSSYSFNGSGILLENTQTAGVVTGNLITGAYQAISVDGGSAGVSAQDNTIATVWSGVSVANGGQLSVHSSDITDYLVPIGTDGAFATGDLTCNWWGDAGGPIDVDPGIATGVFTPWAIASVAGTGTTSCSGG